MQIGRKDVETIVDESRLAADIGLFWATPANRAASVIRLVAADIAAVVVDTVSHRVRRSNSL